MEDGLTPCPRAERVMREFDALPPAYRRFLAHYPRGVKADQAAALLRVCGGDVDEAIAEIRAAMPVRRIG